jgi:hypothetical protein
MKKIRDVTATQKRVSERENNLLDEAFEGTRKFYAEAPIAASAQKPSPPHSGRDFFDIHAMLLVDT